MTSSLPGRPRQSERAAQPGGGPQRWKLEDAKARFSEVVRRAATVGPQLVTVRGKETAVILAAEHYKRLLPKQKNVDPLSRFLKGLGLAALEVDREVDTGRDIDL